jgi:hypothetical protein
MSSTVGSRGIFTDRKRLIKVALLCFVVSIAANGQSEGFSFNSAGGRFGVGANESAKDFYLAEAFTEINLPWSWHGNRLRLESRLDVGMGWLGERHMNAAIGEAGPMLVLSYKQFPVTLAVGSSLTGLSRSDFDSKDLGIPFQFTTHIGLNWDFAERFRVGYRYQHTSNAGLDKSNPGLNMHVLALSYLF